MYAFGMLRNTAYPMTQPDPQNNNEVFSFYYKLNRNIIPIFVIPIN